MKRRSVVKGLAAVSVITVTGCGGSSGGSNQKNTTVGGVQSDNGTPENPVREVEFLHGVASGDPLADRVILWSRVTPKSPASEATDRIPVTVHIARDENLDQKVATQTVEVGPETDYCVKVDAKGLSPDTWYYFAFSVGNKVSPVGRTRTFPAGNAFTDRARFATVSCANFPYGLFSVYRAVADQPDLDFVLHMGDYIYEYEPGNYDDPAAVPNRVHEPANEIVTLSDYRMRHAQYKRDPDLQAVHQQYPMICIWDDHESANDSWKGGAENHSANEGDWQQRKAHAIQAYFEWLPLREIPNEPQRIWRRFQFGDLIDLTMMDTRLEGRDQQAEEPVSPEVDDPDRHLISEAQMQWLLDGLSNASARWKMIGQQVMFAQLNLAELPGVDSNDPFFRQQGINTDQWDGYTADRYRILDHIDTNGIDNVVVFTGDIHTSWANEVYKNPATLVGDKLAEPLAAEFVAPAVTSPGFPEELADLVSAGLETTNPHMRYTELKSRGFVLVDVTRERTQAEYYYVTSISDPDRKGELDASKTKLVAVNHQSSRIQEDGLTVSRPRSLRTALSHPKVTETSVS